MRRLRFAASERVDIDPASSKIEGKNRERFWRTGRTQLIEDPLNTLLVKVSVCAETQEVSEERSLGDLCASIADLDAPPVRLSGHRAE